MKLQARLNSEQMSMQTKKMTVVCLLCSLENFEFYG